MTEIKICAGCRWCLGREDEEGRLTCGNLDSEYLDDRVGCDHSCEKWEEMTT